MGHVLCMHEPARFSLWLFQVKQIREAATDGNIWAHISASLLKYPGCLLLSSSSGLSSCLPFFVISLHSTLPSSPQMHILLQSILSPAPIIFPNVLKCAKGQTDKQVEANSTCLAYSEMCSKHYKRSVACTHHLQASRMSCWKEREKHMNWRDVGCGRECNLY